MDLSNATVYLTTSFKLLKHVKELSVSYLYGIELTADVVLASPQPAEGLLSPLLLAHREKPPGGGRHEQ